MANLPNHCELCPRRCGANRAAGERGVCGAADELRIARAALHYWEEPPISGEAGSGTVFFSHCPLHCVYCQNAGIANGTVGCNVSVERLARIYLELQEQGALNVNLVTASHYVPQALEALDMARRHGLVIPVVYNTSGYETVETVQMLAPYVDTFLTDYRYSSADTARAYSHASDYPQVAQAAIQAMVDSGADVIVRILLLPDHLEETKESVRYLWQTYGDRIVFSMMSQYTPVGEFPQHPELERTIEPQEFEELLDYTDALGCEDYFWQDGEAASESFIPDFNALVGVEGPELED